MCLIDLLFSFRKTPSPPVAKKIRHEMEMFGDLRVDNYYWLRDDSRTDPDVLDYLCQENAYTKSLMSGIYISTITYSKIVCIMCMYMHIYYMYLLYVFMCICVIFELNPRTVGSGLLSRISI